MMRSRRNKRGMPPLTNRSIGRGRRMGRRCGLGRKWRRRQDCGSKMTKPRPMRRSRRGGRRRTRWEPRAATIEEDQRAAGDRNFSSAGEVQAARAKKQSLVGARQAGRWNFPSGRAFWPGELPWSIIQRISYIL